MSRCYLRLNGILYVFHQVKTDDCKLLREPDRLNKYEQSRGRFPR